MFWLHFLAFVLESWNIDSNAFLSLQQMNTEFQYLYVTINYSKWQKKEDLGTGH